MERYPEMLDELRKVVALDQNNLDARLKLGNYYVAAVAAVLTSSRSRKTGEGGASEGAQ
jgi:hypothetical protein